nr:hypothetical protein BaRGS_034382 [Batillaria attramentaria]
MCYKDDKWVMMVNQTHPKILSRLQIGLDAARKAMANGQSFEVTFAFTKLVEKLYRKTLTKSEQEAAANHLDLVKTYFRYAEWEYDEIRERLPAWTVNGVSPLENIGDHVPAENYSYAQAGRLYESFRKKKRKPRTDVGDMSAGGAPEPRPTASDGIELKVMGGEGENRRWRRYNEYENDVEDDHGFRPQGSSGVGPGHVSPSAPPLYGAGASFYDGGVPTGAHAGHVQSAYPEDDGFYEEKGAKPKAYRPQGQFDSHGHLYTPAKMFQELMVFM